MLPCPGCDRILVILGGHPPVEDEPQPAPARSRDRAAPRVFRPREQRVSTHTRIGEQARALRRHSNHLLPVRREAAALQHARPQSARGQRAGTVDYRICYSSGVGDWDIYLTSEVPGWLENLQATDAKSAGLADDAIYALSRSGPAPGRPLVDTITASKIKNLKELRPGSSGTSEIRILFVFDPWRSATSWSPATSPASGTAGMPRRSRTLNSSMRST